MNDWKVVTLADCASFQEGYVNPSKNEPSYFGGTIKWLRATDLNNGFVYKTSQTLTEKGFLSAKKSAVLFEPDSLAISKSGTIGRIGILKDYMCGNRAVINIKVNENICNPLFIFYALLNSKEQIETLAEGSVQKNLYVSALSKVKLLLPDINKQKEIGYILNTLDQKIELNTQINQTLEQIAQALFKSWFVDFDPVRAKVQALSDGLSLEQAELAAMQAISGKTPEELTALSQTQPDRYAELAETAKAFPCEMVEVDGGEVPKGWEIQYLKDICNIVYGKNLPTTKLIKEGYPVFGGNGVIGYYDKFLYETPQTLVSCRGAASGKVLYSLPYSFVTNNSLVIEHEKSGLSYFYIYEALKLQNLTELTSGSAQPQMTIANMAAVQILVPSEKINEVCKKYLGTLYNQIYQNNIENETLAQTRDLLLPKFLSGDFND